MDRTTKLAGSFWNFCSPISRHHLSASRLEWLQEVSTLRFVGFQQQNKTNFFLNSIVKVAGSLYFRDYDHRLKSINLQQQWTGVGCVFRGWYYNLSSSMERYRIYVQWLISNLSLMTNGWNLNSVQGEEEYRFVSSRWIVTKRIHSRKTPFRRNRQGSGCEW